MRRPLGCGRGGLAALVVLASGCAEELGPERKPTATVSGVVRAGGRPVGGGWIEFQPVGETVGDLCSAPLRPDGTFTAEAVAVGQNRIGLVHIATDPRLARSFHPMNTPIERLIRPGRSRTLELDLYEEAARRHEVRPPLD